MKCCGAIGKFLNYDRYEKGFRRVGEKRSFIKALKIRRAKLVGLDTTT